MLSLPLLIPGYMLYYEYLRPHMIAANYDAKLINNYRVENIEIYECDTKYLFFLHNKQSPFIVDSSKGINREEAKKIAEKFNIRPDEVRISIDITTSGLM